MHDCAGCGIPEGYLHKLTCPTLGGRYDHLLPKKYATMKAEPTGTITAEMLKEALDKIRDAPMTFHGIPVVVDPTLPPDGEMIIVNGPVTIELPPLQTIDGAAPRKLEGGEYVRRGDWMRVTGSFGPLSKGCRHEWKEYEGFTERYTF